MLDKPPPSRYKVIERDRRLVTIDTWSGHETGGAIASEAVSPKGRATRLGAGPHQKGQGRATSGATTVHPSVTTPSNAQPAKPGPWHKSPSPSVMNERQMRIISLVAIGLAVGAFLILTGLWVPLGIALLVPQIRIPVWAAIKPAILRYLNGSG